MSGAVHKEPWVGLLGLTCWGAILPKPMSPGLRADVTRAEGSTSQCYSCLGHPYSGMS